MKTACLVIVLLVLPQVGCFLSPSITHTHCDYLTLGLVQPCTTKDSL